MIGVDYDVFWNLNPKSLKPFIKAFSLKQEVDDRIAWQHGKYVQMAISTSLSKSAKYPDKPLMDKSVHKDVTQFDIKERFMKSMKLINSQFGKE